MVRSLLSFLDDQSKFIYICAEISRFPKWSGNFAYLLPLIYAFIKDGMKNGQSWGKKAMRIKVIKVADSSDCTKGRSALRNLIGSLIACIPLVGLLIEPIRVLVTADGRRLADKVVETMVVNV